MLTCEQPTSEAASELANLFDRLITDRRSVRAFLNTPIPERTIREILTVASRAPSSSNTQPWKVQVVTGAALRALSADLLAAHERKEPERKGYSYYPVDWRAPYLERRRTVGWRLYELAGVEKGDRGASWRQHGRNYIFFDAPVGLVFTIDNDMEAGSWLDYGIFLQSTMLAAAARGLSTCPQAAIANYPEIIRNHLAVPADELVVCGMALGHADPTSPVNKLASDREPIGEFVRFYNAVHE